MVAVHDANDGSRTTARDERDIISATTHDLSDKNSATTHDPSDKSSETARDARRREVGLEPRPVDTSCYVAAMVTKILAIFTILATCSAVLLSSRLTPQNRWFHVPASRRDHVLVRAFQQRESRVYTGDGGDSGAFDRRERMMREDGDWFEEATRRMDNEQRVLEVSSLLNVRLTWPKQRRASEQQGRQSQQAQDQARTRRTLKQRAGASRGASESATTGAEFIDKLLVDKLPIPKEPKVTVGEIVVQALQLRIDGNPMEPQSLALYMSARMNASGSMLNPNAYTMLADTIWMNAKYKGRRVGNTKIHNVQVKGHTTAPFAVPMRIVDYPIVSGSSYSTLIAVMSQKLPIDVLITTLARIRYNSVTSPQVKAYMKCKAIVNSLTIQVISQVCGSSSIGL